MDRFRAPLYEQIAQHHRLDTSSFHVPGHKSGTALDRMNTEEFFLLGGVMSIDLTEITGLDDLHQPNGVIKEAQELAADCFGAEHTFFLVNGSTVGNLALIAALCDRDDILIVQRNVHKSVIHGMMLAGVKAVFLPPRWDEYSGLAAGVVLEDVAYALRTYPEAKGIMLSNPNYYGMGIDLVPIITLSHAFGKPVLVDEAHGAHYGFHPDVPASALSSGADAVVQSTHKMLTAMTMGAMLHIQGPLLDREAIQQRLALLQSSSPSYPIMASLDICRRKMHISGLQSISEGLEAVNYFKARFMQEGSCSCFIVAADGQRLSTAYETLDPFKITIRDATGTLNGFQLKSELERFGCFCEMADQNHVLLVFSLASRKKDSDRLIQAFCQISAGHRLGLQQLQETGIMKFATLPHHISVSLPILFNMRGLSGSYGDIPVNKRTVKIQDAVNAYSAEMVTPYPPGIPVLYPGELITQQTADYLQLLSSSGAAFHGAKEVNLKTIRVFIVEGGPACLNLS